MNGLVKSLEINYLSIDPTSELDSIIREKYTRLKNVCGHISKCQIKVANIAKNKKQVNNSYLISVSITMPEGFDVYTLRFPQINNNDSLERAIADVFAKIYRKLIELRLEFC